MRPCATTPTIKAFRGAEGRGELDRRHGHISTSTYNPAPPDRAPACLEQTMAYMRCEGMQAVSQSLITRMAVAHAHFEAVHPFADGNGRVGRLLLPLMMAAEGQVPSISRRSSRPIAQAIMRG
ncbi:Fic family protein [Novosphingobium pokkalii]|uniref:Fic family protein n=1 Tax=Novosphingobium pokkalii TaxID=1770194 RepID=UPI0036370AB2